jgi:hypothetical protein
MKVDELERRFDEGGDVSEFLDVSGARRPGYEQKRVNVDFPVWIIEAFDKEAQRLGVTRYIIETQITERLER